MENRKDLQKKKKGMEEVIGSEIEDNSFPLRNQFLVRRLTRASLTSYLSNLIPLSYHAVVAKELIVAPLVIVKLIHFGLLI